MIYSAEKFPNGSSIVFGHYSFGIVPLIAFPTQEDLSQFILLLKSCEDKIEIPETFRKAFDGS